MVGLGSIGRRHVSIVHTELPDVQIAALRHQLSSGDTPAGITRTFADIEEALAFAPDAAVIASPSTRHLETATALARAGVHLLIEKPLAGSPKGVPALLEECDARGVTLMVGYNLRFLRSLQTFRTLLEEGRVGSLSSVRAEIGQYLPSWRPGVDYRSSVTARRELGGGALLELSHEIDYLRWLFGEVETVSAIVRQQGRLEIDVEDTALLTLGFAAADGASLVATLGMDLLRHDTTRCCTAIGEAGTLRWDAITGRVELFEKGGSAWTALYSHLPDRDESYTEEWRHFLRCIAEGTRPFVTGEDGLAVLRIVDAARVSSSTGASVRVDPPVRAATAPSTRTR